MACVFFTHILFFLRQISFVYYFIVHMLSGQRVHLCALVQVVRHLSGVIFYFHLLMCILGSSQQTSVLSTKMDNNSQQGGSFLASSGCCLLPVHLDIPYFTLHHASFCFYLQTEFLCVSTCMYMGESMHCVCVCMCACGCGL